MIENFPGNLQSHNDFHNQNQPTTMFSGSIQNQTATNAGDKNFNEKRSFNEQITKISSDSTQNGVEKSNIDKNMVNCLRQPSLVPSVNVESFAVDENFGLKNKIVDQLCTPGKVPCSPGFLNPYKVLPPLTPSSKPLKQDDKPNHNYLQNFDWASDGNFAQSNFHLKPANPSKKRQLSISPLSIDEIASLFRISPTIHSIFGAPSRRPSNDFSPLHTGMVVERSPFPSRGSSAFVGGEDRLLPSNHQHQPCNHNKKAGGGFLAPHPPPPSLPETGSGHKVAKCEHFTKGDAKSKKSNMARSEDGGWVCRWIKCGVKFKVSL